MCLAPVALQASQGANGPAVVPAKHVFLSIHTQLITYDSLAIFLDMPFYTIQMV
jgi:hypothetical protein